MDFISHTGARTLRTCRYNAGSPSVRSKKHPLSRKRGRSYINGTMCSASPVRRSFTYLPEIRTSQCRRRLIKMQPLRYSVIVVHSRATKLCFILTLWTDTGCSIGILYYAVWWNHSRDRAKKVARVDMSCLNSIPCSRFCCQRTTGCLIDLPDYPWSSL